MLDQLRLEDTYLKLRRRALDKARSLAEGAGRKPDVPPPVLVAWYFGTRLKTNVPDDLADYAANIGLSDLRDFHALIAAEYAVAADRAKRSGSGRSRK
jgi:hypothetical protein